MPAVGMSSGWYSQPGARPAAAGFTPLERRRLLSAGKKIADGSVMLPSAAREAPVLTGFTLIELLVVIGLIAVLAGAVLVAVNPARQFAQARNSQRASHVNTILNAIGQNMADHQGNWTCAAGVLPTTAANMSNGASDYNIRACLVPDYISELPVDPRTGVAFDDTNYNTHYTVAQNSTTGRVTVSATDTEIPPATAVINATR